MEQPDNNTISMLPVISVVIATYQRTELLSKCLRALNRQTLTKNSFEVIVVHDGEDFRTEKWIKKSFPWVRYYSRKEKKGLAAARNYGWLIAKGKLIAFTDDDCLPDKNWLNQIFQNYNDEKEIAYMGRVSFPVPKFPAEFPLNPSVNGDTAFITANCICSKDALIRVGGFDERFKMAWREDKDLEFKLMAENIPIKQLQDAFVVHPLIKPTWGFSIREQKKRMFNALLYKKFPFFYRQTIHDKTPYFYYLMIFLFFGMMYGVISENSDLLVITMCSYLALLLWFTIKRLKDTSLKIADITEVIIASFVIPFVCVYWQWYGALKYKVLFLR